ncbi:hypothetical protein jhhlp_006970 [Lomentospora prolificans]|uniref:Major facilitator superfamily (MFS) profile domain-containing protein n=1 Tax=Lomentospora prolificans TaxID=41688 RepID=A0A2N3N1B4_9PEZI|nr:hypothetical protein jhhlp_006970 [Lomentospora prolificans]
MDDSIKERGEVSLDPAATTTQRLGYYPATPEEELLDKRINLKMDLIAVVLVAAGFLFQGIDKSNIGNAATTETFVPDTGILKTDVSDSVSLFSATYVPFMPISLALAYLLGPGRWIPIMILGWGAVTLAQCALHGRAMLFGLRLLLGIFEAGYVATSYYYVGTLYPAYMAGFRMGLVSTSFTFAGAFSALIAYGILQLESSRWANWQLLFIIQGSITLGIGAACLALPTRLSKTWFLSPEERAHAVRRMELDTAIMDGANGHANSEDNSRRVKLKNIVTAFRDWRKILIVVWTACASVPAYGFAIFLPLIVQGMGYKGVKANLMSVPPFLVGAVALITWVWLSDHFKQRSLVASAAMFVSIIGYIILIASHDDKVRYGSLFLVMIGAGSINPLSAAWINDNTPDKATRSIMMGIYGWNNVAGVIAGQIYSSKYAPSYKTSVKATLGIVALGATGFLVSRGLYMLENKKRRREIENWTEEQFEEEKANMDRQGHNKKYFVFGY